MTKENSSTPDLSIIMVAYNSEDFIGKSLEALSTASAALEVIVIDNSENHASLPVVSSTYPSAITIASEENLGFARAVNLAAQRASGQYIMLLNPDCVIQGDSVDALVATIRRDPQIGVLAPTIKHPSGRLSVRSAGFEPTAMNMFSQLLGLCRWRITALKFKGFNLYPAGERFEETIVDWVSGACLVTKRTLWVELAGLSERWFMYAEDIEYCRRSRDRGFSVVHTAKATAEHVVGASSETPTGPVWTLWIENLADYYVREFSPSRVDWLVWRLATWATFWSRAQVYGLKAQREKSDGANWQREREKFLAYANAAMTSPAFSNQMN